MRIAVINTGGTISCAGSPLTPMSAADFARACETLISPILLQNYPTLNVHYVVDLPFPESSTRTLDSTNLQPTDWCRIAGYILQTYDSVDGWVVLHGTDSMDFSGGALPFLLNAFDSQGNLVAALSKPVVITGSQMPMFYRPDPTKPPTSLIYNTDAFQNFCGAVAAAQSGIPEVCVYFQNHIYRGNRVLKTSASEFNAFSSPNYPALGEYGVELTITSANLLPGPVSASVSLDDTNARALAQAQLSFVAANINSYPVMQFNAFPAWYSFPASGGSHGYPSDTSPRAGLLASLINAYVAPSIGVKGLILESYGEGNFPSGDPDVPSNGATYQALMAANNAGVVIVDCTQVISGVVNNNAYAAGAWLPQVGALSPADMTPMAALAKLMVLLTAAAFHGWSIDVVKSLFQLNLLGEMLSTSRLDSRGDCTLLVNQCISTPDGSASFCNDPVSGPILQTSDGQRLWTAVDSLAPNDLPGVLSMQNDGNLVFYSRNNVPLWASNTGIYGGAPSRCELSGSTSNQSVNLRLFNYENHTTTAILFSQP